jgi:hypothetical protein
MIKLALKAGLLWFITKIGKEYMQSATKPSRPKERRQSRK